MNYDIGELNNKLTRCENISLSEVNKEELDDISNINIDKRKSSNERLLDFLMKVKNPYVFKVKGKLVKISFSEDSNKTADDCLTNVLKNLY